MQECSPESSSLIKAVPMDLHGLVLSPPSDCENPVPLGFPEICMGSTWRPECVSPQKWLCPHLPALFPHSFFRISLCVLMLGHFMTSVWRCKIANREEIPVGSSKQSGGSRDKAGRCLFVQDGFHSEHHSSPKQPQGSLEPAISMLKSREMK